MSVENFKILDVIGIDKNENAVLTISDHLEWDSDNEHLMILQNKINAYLEAIENGSLYIDYPKAIDRKIIINIIAKYEPSEDGKIFLDRISALLSEAGYGFKFSVVAD